MDGAGARPDAQGVGDRGRMGLAARNLYLERLERTRLTRQISSIVEEFRDELPRQRPPRTFPH